MTEWDVFISYASEDRDPFVISLVAELRKLGLSVWYDAFEIRLGDSMREKIDYGIVNSRYGVVILSAAYFGKLWTSRELDGLLGKESFSTKMLLPVWHGVGREEVHAFSPIVASRRGTASSAGAASISQEIRKAIPRSSRVKFLPYASGAGIYIIEKWGVVCIESFAEPEDERMLEVFDFGTHQVDAGAEFKRFFQTEGTMRRFEEFVAFVLISQGGVPQNDIASQAIRTVETDDLVLPFVPLFSNDVFTVGIFNEEVARIAGPDVLERMNRNQ